MEWILLVVLLWNVVAFVVVAKDKKAARRNMRRTPERVFRNFALTFGGAGVLVGFYTVRHKTKHHMLLFQVISLTVLSYALLAFVYYKFLILRCNYG